MSDFEAAIPEELRERRRLMLERDLRDRGIRDPRVLAAMAKVPREAFVPSASRYAAYDDSPLRIGSGQTISQPYMVALMTECLMVEPGMKVLEVGTGSGYQTAILAELGAEVFSIERHEDLSYVAEAVIDRLGYGGTVTLRVDDGTLGWPEEAPFDRIIVTAAGPSIPASLRGQLKEDGVLLIPVGEYRETQKLLCARKQGGELMTREVLDVVFVPLIGAEGY